MNPPKNESVFRNVQTCLERVPAKHSRLSTPSAALRSLRRNSEHASTAKPKRMLELGRVGSCAVTRRVRHGSGQHSAKRAFITFWNDRVNRGVRVGVCDMEVSPSGIPFLMAYERLSTYRLVAL